MEAGYRQLVKERYENSREDATELFRTLLAMAEETGLDAALDYLEECVCARRMAWMDRQAESIEQTGNSLLDGFNLFYTHYLGLSLPRDGELVEANEGCIRVRWSNRCPTLEACKALGLDTREICRKVYERPVQLMLSRIDPRLRFVRNYAALRPSQAYCEESIELDLNEEVVG